MTRLSSLSRSVEGSVVLVTGAASGMGRAIAHLFADEGALVAAVDRDAEGVAETVGAIDDAHGPGRAADWTVDLADPAAIDQLVAEVVERLGSVDVLVNNAGVAVPAVVEGDGAAYEAAWALTFAVDLTAHQRLVRACLPHLRRDGRGRVVNIASTEGLGASRYNSPYVAAKHGVIGLTRALAVELGALGVNVNAVCPGPIRTGMTAGIPDDAKDKFARRMVPLRRYGDPEEVAHAVLALSLPAASFTNGAVLVVDGGLTVKND
ncbi:MAG: SDR family oxidoreductase [Acidimicrobiia bacterium]|nr:SDR family oxidoreductase [Acidimicrobiia bacterium]